MLERTDAITNEVLEPISFVLAYLTVLYYALTRCQELVLRYFYVTWQHIYNRC